MISFGVKILWFVLSLTGLISSWVVLIPFGRAVGAMWGPLNFCIGNTLLQGIFCLGMIWKMNPFLMPRDFCIAQTIIIGSATFLLTGVTGAFSMATSLTVLKPRSWDDHTTLRWRQVFWIPVLVFPLVATLVHVIAVVKLDSVKPTDDLHCDSSDPLWVRFLGYAGLPFLVTVPCAFLSFKSLITIYKTNQHIKRACKSTSLDTTGNSTSLAPRSVVSVLNKEDSLPGFGYNPPLLASTVTSVMTSSPSLISANEHTSVPRSTGSAPFLMDGQWPPAVERKFHLPFRPPQGISGRNQRIPEEDDEVSDVSSTLPRFLTPEPRGKGVVNPQGAGVVGEETEGAGTSSKYEASTSGVYQRVESEQVGAEARSDSRADIRDDESNILGETVSLDRVSGRNVVPVGYASQPNLLKTSPLRSLPSLAPAIWRMILFQTAFCVVQVLTCISTIIDLARHRPSPTPLGTQHFALLLAAWGPAIVFGHSPAVRKSLRFWHRRA